MASNLGNSSSKLLKCVLGFIRSAQKAGKFSSARNIPRSRVPASVRRKPPFLIVSFLCGVFGSDEKKTKEEDTREELVHNVALATIALKDGNIEKSGQMLLEVLDLAETNDFPLGVVSACDMLSSLAIKLGDYERAENLLIKALDNLHSQGAPADDNYVVSFNLKLSRLYSNNGNDDLAESGFKNCLKLQRNKLDAHVDEETFLLWTTTLYWYGKFLLSKKRFREAKSCFRDCYLTSLKREDLLPSQIMVILYNLGDVCQILGEHDEAIEFLLEAVKLDKKCKNPDLTYFYSKLGSASMHKGLYNEAKLWCKEAQKFAVKYRNLDAEQESNACLEQLNTFFDPFILHNEGSRNLWQDLMNELKIQKYRIVDNGSEKPFCVYMIEANINDRKYVVEKRYSQFHALHGELKKLYPTPYFPPKKVRSLQQRLLEKRRQALEKYLQEMIKFNQSRSQVLSFLGLSKSDTEYGSEKITENKSGHQPLFQFKKDFTGHRSRKSNLPDIVEEGVLLGFYKSP